MSSKLVADLLELGRELTLEDTPELMVEGPGGTVIAEDSGVVDSFHGLGLIIFRGPAILACVPTDLFLFLSCLRIGGAWW